MARSGKHVKVDGLADAILDELKKYSEEATETLHNTAKEVAKDGVKSLKSTSPRGKGSRKGHYADSWYIKTERPKKSKSSNIIHNKMKPGLTHLLERGHQLRQGGRAKAIVHIKPVEEWCNEEFEKRIEERLGR